MDKLEDIMDEHFAYEYVTDSDNYNHDNGDGCLTWLIRITFAYYVLTLIFKFFS